MYTHRTNSPFPSTSDRLLSPLTIRTSHLTATLVQEVPADSVNFLWGMTDSIAVLEDSYSKVVVNVIDLALNWQLFSDVGRPRSFVNVMSTNSTLDPGGGGLYSRLIAYSNISPPPTLGWM